MNTHTGNNPDQPHDRGGTHDDIEGPPTVCQAAALSYRDHWGWPTHASTDAVWLRLPMTMAAISIIIPDTRRTELLPALERIPAPIIDYADGYYTILTHCTILTAEHLGIDQSATGDHHAPVVHLAPPTMIDLPPSIVDGTTTTWLCAPAGDEPLPSCSATLMLVRNLLAHQ